MNRIKSEKVKLKTRRTFLKKGTCSRTFFYILNQEFGFPKDYEEQASDLLAGGIMQQGYQCGMLWGTSFAIGAEAHRKYGNSGKAISVSVEATRQIIKNFSDKINSIECCDITNCKFTHKSGLLKFFVTGKPVKCMNLAAKWAPSAIDVANDSLSIDESELYDKSMSCATEVARKMGASDEEMIMVSGFAGGMGLSGNGCGALSAAIWMESLKLTREMNGKSVYPNSKAQKTLDTFLESVGYDLMCENITGMRFTSIEEHSEFIKSGGCKNLINILATANE